MTLILSRADVESLASMEDAIPAVEHAFAAFARGEAQMPAKVYLDLAQYHGDFRAMPARVGDLCGLKWVNSHTDNEERFGLPAVMGVYILSDPKNAMPLAIMDATAMTGLRTGAAAGVASKFLAPKNPTTLGIIGCGVQAHRFIEAHRILYPDINIVAYDRNPDHAHGLAKDTGCRVATSGQEAAAAEIVCTGTPSHKPVVEHAWLPQSCHINAMGADGPGKQELELATLKRARIFIDDWHQAEGGGEINVPLAAGELTKGDVTGELGQVVAGTLPGRQGDGVTIFDSTGLAIQDVVVAEVIFRRAVATGAGQRVDLVGFGAP